MFNISKGSPVVVFYRKDNKITSHPNNDSRIADILIGAEIISIRTSKVCKFNRELYSNNSEEWHIIRGILYSYGFEMGYHFEFSRENFKVFLYEDKIGEWLLVAPDKYVLLG